MTGKANIIETESSAAAPAVELVRQIAATNSEPDWLLERRVKALELYQTAELPSRVTHLWRYTDPKEFVIEAAAFGITSGGQGQVEQETRQALNEEDLSGAAIVHNGSIAEVRLEPALRDKGVLISDLHRAAIEQASLVQSHLGITVPAEHGKFEALNMALWQSGVLIYVPKNVVLPKPLHIVFSGDEAALFLAPRLLVVAESSSQVSVVLEMSSPRGTEFAANAIVELSAAQNAHVRMITVSRWSDKVTSFYTQRSCVARDGSVETVWAGLGGRVTKCDIGTKLFGAGARTNMWGLSFAQDKQHFDAHTEHWHASSHTTSDMDYKVVLKDKSRSIYTGLIRIDRAAKGCEAYQENRNLLLSEGPLADTIPELEILNEDVKCTHGATIGPVDQEEIFYLQARGIPRDEATRIVIGGFVHDTLTHVPEQLKDRLESYVAERLKEI